MYDLKVWSILHEWDTCMVSVKELEEVLVAEESTDEEAEMRKEKVLMYLGCDKDQWR